MTKQKQIISLINGVIRKKLENIVLDTMDHPEDVPEDIIDAAKISAELGYSEINLGINEIFNEVGRIQIERTIQKRTRKRERELKERQFQDYLIANPGRIEDIEKGLKILEPEKKIRSGILDIDALDEKGDKARIELKAVDYDSIATHVKIEKYLYEDDTKKARVFFAAPEVKPDLFFSLRDLQEQGKVRFFEYDFDFENQTYCTFKEIKANDFEEPKNIPWDKIKRKKADNGLIRVTTAVGKPERKIERKSSEREEIEETKEQEREKNLERIAGVEKRAAKEELESCPLYYKILLRNKPNLKDKKRYLQITEINREQLRRLEKLVVIPELESVITDYENHKEWFIDPERWSNEFENAKDKLTRKPFSNNPKKTEALFRRFANKSINLQTKLEDQVVETIRGLRGTFEKTDKEYNEDLNNLKEKQIKLSNLIEQVTLDSDMFQLKMFLRDSMQKLSQSAENKAIGAYIKDMLFRFSYPVENITNEFTKSKITRTEELMRLDKNLALVYFYFGYETNVILKEGKTPPNFTWEIGSKNLVELVKADDELYKSILSHFRIKGDWSKYPFYYQVMLLHDIAPEDRESYLEPIEVSQKEMKQLEALKTSSDLEAKLSQYKEEGDFDEEHPKEIDLEKVKPATNKMSLKEHKELLNGLEIYKDVIKSFNAVTDLMLVYLSGQKEKPTIDGLEKAKRMLNGLIVEIDRGNTPRAKKLRKILDFLEEDIKEAQKYGDEFIEQFLKKYSRFKREKVLASFLELKVERAKALEEIDGNLTQAYLIYSVNTDEALKSQNKQVLEPKESLAHVKIKSYIERDTQLYKSILENLIAKEEPVEIVTEVTKPEVVELEVKPLAKKRVEHVKTKTHYGYPVSSVIPNRVYESLEKDKQMIVNEFVNGILNNPEYNNSTRKKYASLARESKWYNKSMDEKQVRDFFGNLAINIEEECDKSKGK